MGESLSAYQAVCLFATWLLERDATVMQGGQDCAIEQLLGEFCQEYGLDDLDPAAVPLIRKAVAFTREIRNRLREFRRARRRAWLENGSASEVLEAWVDPTEVESLCSFVEAQANEIQRLWRAIAMESEAIEQTLGRVLGYGCDMRAVGGVEDDVCVGEHVPATLAAEAAHKITALRKELSDAHATIEMLEAELNGRPKEL